MIVLHDAWFFFTHRLMHHPKLFKHVHRVHHRSVDPSPFAAFSFHPLEAIIEGAVYVVFSFLFPVHLLALLAWQFLQMILNVIGHLGYEIYPKGFNTHWLFKWKTPSTHHNMHHAKFNGNYGLYFTWWDRIFKTEFKDYNETYEKVQERIGTKTRNTSVLLVLLFANLSTFAQNEIVGQWLSENKKGITTIYEQDGKYWGKITWLKTPKDETGRPMADKENPDKKLRNQALQGLLILKNFVYKNNGWRDGNIYDPERGKTFTCTLVLTNAKTLKVRGYWGIFYETQFWTRV
jgi:uncharacterized protein (DUF2147 family)